MGEVMLDCLVSSLKASLEGVSKKVNLLLKECVIAC